MIKVCSLFSGSAVIVYSFIKILFLLMQVCGRRIEAV